MKILVLNCGSSSLKYQLIDMETDEVIASGKYERIGEKEAFISSKLSTTLYSGFTNCFNVKSIASV